MTRALKNENALNFENLNDILNFNFVIIVFNAIYLIFLN